jgi:hypothetical protein
MREAGNTERTLVEIPSTKSTFNGWKKKKEKEAVCYNIHFTKLRSFSEMDCRTKLAWDYFRWWALLSAVMTIGFLLSKFPEVFFELLPSCLGVYL